MADLSNTNCTNANFHGADLRRAMLLLANMSNTDFSDAKLGGADLGRANFSMANLSKVNFEWACLTDVNFQRATLTGCSIYGISVWNVDLEEAKQLDLIITRADETTITVDDLEVAQFIHLLLNNKKIRDVIDNITSKVVLILGRFTDERKVVLDALRNELRKRNYIPVLFDFEKPISRDFTETIRTLAHLSGFILADLTDPSSLPQELQAIVPDLEIPVIPLLLEAKREYSMFVDFSKYHWVLPIYLYKDQANLIASLQNEIIEPAEKKTRELTIEKAKRLERL
jgi:hypothetical protein